MYKCITGQNAKYEYLTIKYIRYKLKVKCFKKSHYAYTNQWGSLKLKT